MHKERGKSDNSQLEHSFSNHTILWRPVTEYYQHSFFYDRMGHATKKKRKKKKKKKKKKEDGAQSELRGTPDETEMLFKSINTHDDC